MILEEYISCKRRNQVKGSSKKKTAIVIEEIEDDGEILTQ